MSYTVLTHQGIRTPIKARIRGVHVEADAQPLNVARLPLIHQWVVVRPYVHYGIGATVSSVVPTKGAITPAPVEVDSGCGMVAVASRGMGTIENPVTSAGPAGGVCSGESGRTEAADDT